MEILRLVVGALPGLAASVLREQVEVAAVSGGIPTLLHLVVAQPVDTVGSEDGPVPVRAFAEGGEVLLWVTGGYLSALEYAWTTDAVPVAMPPAHTVAVGG